MFLLLLNLLLESQQLFLLTLLDSVVLQSMLTALKSITGASSLGRSSSVPFATGTDGCSKSTSISRCHHGWTPSNFGSCLAEHSDCNGRKAKLEGRDCDGSLFINHKHVLALLSHYLSCLIVSIPLCINPSCDESFLLNTKIRGLHIYNVGFVGGYM